MRHLRSWWRLRTAPAHHAAVSGAWVTFRASTHGWDYPPLKSRLIVLNGLRQPEQLLIDFRRRRGILDDDPSRLQCDTRRQPFERLAEHFCGV
jgi:hypothetical protein